ncbi:uncharacterized protein LOC143502790 [Brachyhypopomus gauderio]|uniref:uncharacterized protein LOC143502790 n=1 Tax=Brachyhypopomus gauderio TaxID=698409 RepID=UPI004042BDE8
MRRMNELWRRMILSVCLCLLLVLRCQGQDDATTLPTGSDPDQDSTTQLPSVGSSRSPTDAPATDGSAVVTDSVVPHATQNNDLSDVIYVSVGTVQPESTYVDLKGAVFAQNPRSQQPVDSTLSPDEVQGIESSEEKPVKTTPTVLISLLLIGLSIAARHS